MIESIPQTNDCCVVQISHVGLVHKIKRILEASGFLLEPSLSLEAGRWGNETVTTKTASPNGTNLHCGSYCSRGLNIRLLVVANLAVLILLLLRIVTVSLLACN